MGFLYVLMILHLKYFVDRIVLLNENDLPFMIVKDIEIFQKLYYFISKHSITDRYLIIEKEKFMIKLLLVLQGCELMKTKFIKSSLNMIRQ